MIKLRDQNKSAALKNNAPYHTNALESIDGALKRLRNSDTAEHATEVAVQVDVLRSRLTTGRLARGNHL